MTVAHVLAIIHAVVSLAVSTSYKRMLIVQRRGCSTTLQQSLRLSNVSYVIVFVVVIFSCRLPAGSAVDV